MTNPVCDIYACTFFARPPPRLSLSFLDGFFEAVPGRPRSGCLDSDRLELDGFLAAGFAANCSSLLTGLEAGLTFLKISKICLGTKCNFACQQRHGRWCGSFAGHKLFVYRLYIPFLSFNGCWGGPNFRISSGFFICPRSTIVTWGGVFLEIVQGLVHVIHLFILLCKFLTNLKFVCIKWYNTE